MQPSHTESLNLCTINSLSNANADWPQSPVGLRPTDCGSASAAWKESPNFGLSVIVSESFMVILGWALSFKLRFGAVVLQLWARQFAGVSDHGSVTLHTF